MSRTTNFVATLALCVAGASASAQDFIPVESIRYAGRYDVATQTFHPSAVDPDVASYETTPSVLFNNTTTNGSLTTASGLIATHHFVDWGTADFGGGGASITEIRIGYATNLLAPGTVALRIRLYQGTTGFGTQGTVIGDYNVTGLPNSTSGGFQGFTVDVTLPTALDMNDGPIGWSYNSDASVATSTGPLTVGPPNETGVEDAYDRYLESTNAYVSTNFFGGTPFASFVMRLTGRPNVAPPSAWENYGVKKIIILKGTGPGTPGSANEVKITSTAVGRPVILMVGVTQSNLYLASYDVNLYAFPWLVEIGPVIPDPANASVLLPFEMPLTAPPGVELYMQSFGQNIFGVWTNFSRGLKLTVQ